MPCLYAAQPTHLILFLQLQRLPDPLQSLLVGEPGPLLAQTVFDVFGCGLEVKTIWSLRLRR